MKPETTLMLDKPWSVFRMGNREGFIEPHMHRLIMTCIVATFCLSAFFFVLAKEYSQPSRTDIDISSVFEKELRVISSGIANRSDESKMVEMAIKGKGISEIIGLANFLYKSNSEKNQRFAAYLALNAGQKYRNPPLLYLSTRYYMKKPIHDFKKAMEILDSKYIAKSGNSDYYRGLIWQDTANPMRDLSKAKLHLEAAREAGVQAAERVLVKLAADSKAAGNSQK